MQCDRNVIQTVEKITEKNATHVKNKTPHSGHKNFVKYSADVQDLQRHFAKVFFLVFKECLYF